MLIRLLPEQVSSKWDELAPFVEKAIPYETLDKTQIAVNILAAILGDKAQAWVYYSDDDEQKPVALVVTTTRHDEVLYTSHLIIYAVSIIQEDASVDLWRPGFATLEQYAKSLGVNSILAFTRIPAIVRICKERLGAEAGALLEFNLNYNGAIPTL